MNAERRTKKQSEEKKECVNGCWTGKDGKRRTFRTMVRKASFVKQTSN
jgi:hypothetical protein